MNDDRILPHPDDPELTLVKLTKGYRAIIDTRFAQAVGKMTWCASVQDGGKRVYAQTGDGRLRLHRFIGELIGLRLDGLVDHVNRDTLDCRAANLRGATPPQNSANRHACIDNSSGFTGVYAERKRGKVYWVAEAAMGGTRSRRYCKTKEEAVSAAVVLGRMVQGDFSSR